MMQGLIDSRNPNLPILFQDSSAFFTEAAGVSCSSTPEIHQKTKP
jgi:hypothetical protein